jgi:hypothetical protein
MSVGDTKWYSEPFFLDLVKAWKATSQTSISHISICFQKNYFTGFKQLHHKVLTTDIWSIFYSAFSVSYSRDWPYSINELYEPGYEWWSNTLINRIWKICRMCGAFERNFVAERRWRLHHETGNMQLEAVLKIRSVREYKLMVWNGNLNSIAEYETWGCTD